jgi:hypothetical protein
MAYWPDFGVTPGGEEITKPCPFPGAGFFSGTLVTTVHTRPYPKFSRGTLGSEGLELARSGQGANFRFGQEHRTSLTVNEFHYLTESVSKH